jgi:hypothetical protein
LCFDHDTGPPACVYDCRTTSCPGGITCQLSVVCSYVSLS